VPAAPSGPDPDHLLTHIAELVARDPAVALRDARAAVRDLPERARAYRVLAAALRAVGDIPEAEQQELRAVELGLRDPAVHRAREALGTRRIEDAAREIATYLRANPDDAGAVHFFGTIAQRSRAVRDAEALFRRSVALAPAYVDAQISLAGLLNKTDRVDEALGVIAAVLAREPTHVAALSLRAGVLVQDRRLDAADAAFRTLTRLHPNDWHAWMSHGHLLKALGRIDDAVAAYRGAIATAPASGILWGALANLKPVRLDAADVAAMQAELAACSDDAERVHLHFALGNTLAALGDHAAAFGHWQSGNSLRLVHVPHDAGRHTAIVRRFETLFTPAFLAPRAEAGALAADPIFIVGMPRSGSTLVEQILASHPAIEGTEELQDLNRVAGAIAAGSKAASYLDVLPSLPPAALRAFGERYLEMTRRYRTTDRPFFTDKMPSNWMHVGLILLILPNAKIVDVRRHPMACGFANFTQHYNVGNGFSYDLEAIGRYYADYVRQMAHFDCVAPGRIHRVHHEALIDDLEGEVRRLLDYLGLPFDPACLRFDETERAVHTPSTEQVRRPINREGVDRWRAYAPWLGPLERALGPVLDHYPAPPPG
jgi:tetratricopeptide (TPR) repeat protein